MVLFYLIYFTVNKIIDAQHGGENRYKRSEVEIYGNQLVSELEILNLCGFNSNHPEKAITIDADKLAKKLINSHYIKGVSITRRLPRKLNITIEERQPAAFIHGIGLNLIDHLGYLMPVPEASTSWDLPVITGIKQNLGQLGRASTTADTYVALEILNYLEIENPLLHAMVSQIDMSRNKYINLYLIRGGTTIHIGRDSYQKELYVLKNYLISYIDWAKLDDIEYIDLRFEDQLIVKFRT